MAILRTYGDLTKRNLTFMNIKAHKVRVVATSWAYHNRISSEDILQAASWKNHSTFSNFYLRSLAAQEGDLFRLGPFRHGPGSAGALFRLHRCLRMRSSFSLEMLKCER